jgi:hypothetical protein
MGRGRVVSWEDDPEVVADLRLRAASERDRTRTGPVATYEAAAVVAHWPCRACRQPTELTETGADRFTFFNRALVARGEAPIDTGAVLFCGACRAEGTTYASRRNREHVDKLAEKIREYKASHDSRRQAELEHEMAKLHHPDLPGLVEAVRQARATVATGDRGRRHNRGGL